MGKAEQRKKQRQEEAGQPAPIWLPAERGRPIGQLQTSVPGLHFNFAIEGRHAVSLQEMAEVQLPRLLSDPEVHVLPVYSPIDGKWHYLTKHGASIVFGVLEARVLDADEWGDVMREAQLRGAAQREIVLAQAGTGDRLRVKN